MRLKLERTGIVGLRRKKKKPKIHVLESGRANLNSRTF